MRLALPFSNLDKFGVGILQILQPGMGVDGPTRGTSQAALLRDIGAVVRERVVQLSGVEWLAEPGRLFVADAAALVVGVKSVNVRTWHQHAGGRIELRSIAEAHLDDGIYGSLMGQEHDGKRWHVELLRQGACGTAPPAPVRLWGATCDTYDCLAGLRDLPADLRAGDALFVAGAGAYTLATATRFNQAARPQVLSFRGDPAGPCEFALADADGAELLRGTFSVGA